PRAETIIGESNSSMISHINLGMKHIDKRSAGKPHADFEEAGAGNGLTAPALDPTPEVVTIYLCLSRHSTVTRSPSHEILPVVVLDKPPVIPIDSSHVFFDHREPNQPSNILDPLSKIAKSRTSVHAILVGINVALDLLSIRH
ncbi:MAG TPA: hypothetical protein VMW72_01495, partial [Sedimentisphaerales bacterium]|nr:hypothetical protein [Sedimentisphaerales bacterium]